MNVENNLMVSQTPAIPAIPAISAKGAGLKGNLQMTSFKDLILGSLAAQETLSGILTEAVTATTEVTASTEEVTGTEPEEATEVAVAATAVETVPPTPSWINAFLSSGSLAKVIVTENKSIVMMKDVSGKAEPATQEPSQMPTQKPTQEPHVHIPVTEGKISNGVFLKASSEQANTEVKNTEPMTKDEKREYLKETTGKGIETASMNNNKEINPEKLEKFLASKMGNTEESLPAENEVTLSNLGKPGALASESIGLNVEPSKVEKPAVYSQIADEIVTTLEKKGPCEFKLQLNPAELGEIDIKIKISDGKLSIDIISARQETQELLSSQVDKLTTKLGIQNFHVENIQVNPSNSLLSQSLSGQGFMLNMGMNLSSRKQQENAKEKNNLKIDGTGNGIQGLKGSDVAFPENNLKSAKFDLYKMNYAI